MTTTDVAWRDCSSTYPKAPPGMIRCVLCDSDAPFCVEYDFASLEEARRTAKPKLGNVWTDAYFYNEHGNIVEELKGPPYDPFK